MTGPLVTPIIESRAFVREDSKYLMMTEKDLSSPPRDDDDDFSNDSWDASPTDDSPPANISRAAIGTDQRNFYTFDERAMKSPKSVTKSSYSKDKLKSHLDDIPGTKFLKRERNRLAARRCRQKQRDRIGVLEKDVKEIESANGLVEQEIQLLQTQATKLTDMLMNHKCVIKLPQLTHSSKFVPVTTHTR